MANAIRPCPVIIVSGGKLDKCFASPAERMVSLYPVSTASEPHNPTKLTMQTSMNLIQAAEKLRDDVEGLQFGTPVTHVYNPLVYAWELHRQYLERYGGGTKEVSRLARARQCMSGCESVVMSDAPRNRTLSGPYRVLPARVPRSAANGYGACLQSALMMPTTSSGTTL